MPQHDHAARVARRRILTLGLGAAMALAARPVLAKSSAVSGVEPSDKVLSFENLHTGEKLKVAFWRGGDYDWEGLRQINQILRDFRTGEVYPIDVKLLNVLHKLDRKFNGGGNLFQIISGYRSPKTNEMLHAADREGVAKKSLHMQGKAIDIRIDGVDLAYVRATAIKLEEGGVGYYPKSQFVHLDLGRVRSW